MQFLKIFRRILAVIIGISLFYILTSKVLPLFGLTLTCSITGTSMKPAMKGYNLAILKKVPFEEIKEGDIIGFNKRVGDDRLMTGGVVLEFRKKVLDENGNYVEPTPGPTPTPSPVPSPTPTVDPNGPLPYITDPTVKFEPRDLQIDPHNGFCHRVVLVGVGEKSEKLVYTKGDNNAEVDRYATSEENYIGKIIWYANYIGFPFYWLVRRRLYIAFIAVFLYTFLFEFIAKKLLRSHELQPSNPSQR